MQDQHGKDSRPIVQVLGLIITHELSLFTDDHLAIKAATAVEKETERRRKNHGAPGRAEKRDENG